jgi:hypothetical protein
VNSPWTAANLSPGNHTGITVAIGLGQNKNRPSGANKQRRSWMPLELEGRVVSQPANRAAHADARASVVHCKGRWARAGGCERWAASEPPREERK